MARTAGNTLRRLLNQHAPISERRAMAHSGAFLFVSGSLLVLATVLTNHAPGTSLLPIEGLVGIALCVAVAMIAGRDAIPTSVYPYLVALGTILITVLMYFDGARASAYSLLYVWAALYSFYFFTPAVAVAEILFIAAGCGLELYLREGSNLPTSRWVMIVGTSVVAGAVIRQLVGHVRSLADSDGLTGLANRRRLDQELDREISRAGRAKADLCVAILDLDHFSAFNDETGRPEGDKHLQKTTAMWLGELRNSDLLARYGGEEFVAMLPNCGRFDALRLADRLRGAVPDGQTASAGVAHWDGQESRASLLSRAEAALYEAKVAGRDRTVEAADPTVPAGDGTAPQAWATMLPKVLDDRDIRFCYQPILRLSDRSVIGYEALARPHGIGVDRSVEGFFAAAQRLGYARDLDWLCRRLCLESSREVITDSTLFMNIGVSALLAPVHGVDQMLLILETAGWSPADVVLEITERELFSDLDRFEEVLSSYRNHGFRFAMDDVGDGHSTLEVLAAGSPEFVKIARRLTSNAGQPGARAAVRAVTAYAASLGSQVIAEGIEDDDQAHLMAELGCQMGQGYALGRPAWPEIRDSGLAPALTVLSA